MKIKNVLIVGSSGFIGNELRENISKEHKVYLIDKKIHKNAKNTNHKFIKYDLYSKKKISYLPNKIDTIFFFAGVTGGENSYKIDEIKKYFKII